MEAVERKMRKASTVEDIEAQIRKLTEKKKAKQHARWLSLGKYTEEIAKQGPSGFEPSSFFTNLDRIMRGAEE